MLLLHWYSSKRVVEKYCLIGGEADFKHAMRSHLNNSKLLLLLLVLTNDTCCAISFVFYDETTFIMPTCFTRFGISKE